MEEKRVLLMPTDGRKEKVVLWTEAMKLLKKSSQEIADAISSGEKVSGYFLDEALTRN